MRSIVLHGRDLDVSDVVATTSRGKVVGTAQARLAFGATEGADELVLAFPEELPPGDAELDIAYQARFAEEQHGLFRIEDEGAAYAFTNFEPIDARRMLPCFDEPAYKTPFQVTLRVPKGNLAFANTSEARRSDDAAAGTTTFEFEPSSPLPTYLVALAVAFIRRRATVEVAVAWAQRHFDEITKASPHFGPLVLARVPVSLCDAERVHAVEAFLRPRLEKLGGASDLKENVDVGLRCAALAQKEEFHRRMVGRAIEPALIMGATKCRLLGARELSSLS
jgi:hypothetical protein